MGILHRDEYQGVHRSAFHKQDEIADVLQSQKEHIYTSSSVNNLKNKEEIVEILGHKEYLVIETLTKIAEYYYEHLNRRIIGSTQKLSEPGRNFYIQAIINL